MKLYQTDHNFQCLCCDGSCWLLQQCEHVVQHPDGGLHACYLPDHVGWTKVHYFSFYSSSYPQMQCCNCQTDNHIRICQTIIQGSVTLQTFWRKWNLHRYEYRWADGVKVKRPIAVSAPKYVEYLMDWIEAQLDDADIFPQHFGNLLVHCEAHNTLGTAHWFGSSL